MRKNNICKCSNTHCCLTCDNYQGGIELLPGTISSIECIARPTANITVQIGGWPKINGNVEKKCSDWR
jgi:hypothetical protein